jgi:DNA-binding MarR family transcriptional regulator
LDNTTFEIYEDIDLQGAAGAASMVVTMTDDRSDGVETAELADMLFTVMPMVADHVNERLEGLGMTTTDYWALRSVDGPMPMKDLATCMDVDPSHVTLVADRLEELGLIERRPHPTDRRVKNLVLTAKGRRFKKTVPDKLWSGPTMFSALTSEDRTRLTGILAKLAAERPATASQA